MRRAYTSITKATYSQPCQVETTAQVGDPELVGALCPELPVNPVQRTDGLGVANGGAHHLAPDDAAQAQTAHEAFHRTTRHHNAFAVHLHPDLVGAIDLHVGLPDPLNMRDQHLVAPGAGTAPVGPALEGGVAPIA